MLAANWPAGILEIPPGELQPTLSSLVKVMGYILNSAPVLTRVLLNQFDTFLTDPARTAKTTRIYALPSQIRRDFSREVMAIFI